MIDLTKVSELKFDKVIDKIEDINGLVIYEAWKKLTVSGVPPITLTKCKGVDLVEYKIYGNSYQETTPSPDYPSEIESVGYKNLFSSEMELGSILGTGVLQVNTNCVRTKDYISITPNTSYNLSNDKSYTLNLYYYDKDKNFISSGSTSTGILTTPSNAYYLKTRTNSGTTQNDLSVKYMLTKGTKKYSYIPYSKYGIEVETTNEIDINTTTIVLKQPLRSLPNGVKDKLYVQNNKLYVERYVGSVVLDGSETNLGTNVVSTDTQINTKSFYLTVSNAPQVINDGLICSKFKTYNVSNIYNIDIEGVWYNGERIYFRINRNRLISENLSGFKTWLSENNTEVLYELAEPYTEEFDEPYNILTFKGTTILSVNTNIQPSNVEVTYIGKQVR